MESLQIAIKTTKSHKFNWFVSLINSFYVSVIINCFGLEIKSGRHWLCNLFSEMLQIVESFLEGFGYSIALLYGLNRIINFVVIKRIKSNELSIFLQ